MNIALNTDQNNTCKQTHVVFRVFLGLKYRSISLEIVNIIKGVKASFRSRSIDYLVCTFSCMCLIRNLSPQYTIEAMSI